MSSKVSERGIRFVLPSHRQFYGRARFGAGSVCTGVSRFAPITRAGEVCQLVKPIDWERMPYVVAEKKQ